MRIGGMSVHFVGLAANFVPATEVRSLQPNLLKAQTRLCVTSITPELIEGLLFPFTLARRGSKASLA